MIRMVYDMCTALFQRERGDRISSRLDTHAECAILGCGCLISSGTFRLAQQSKNGKHEQKRVPPLPKPA